MNVKGKRVVILGAGVAGKGAADLLAHQGASDIHLFGRAAEGVIDGESHQAQQELERADLLVKSPGVPWEHSLLQKALTLGMEVVGEADLACSYIDTPLIVVTGTNGKTTTVGWLEEAFRRAGVAVGGGGNMGIPVSALVEESRDWEVLILELSSFQLERVRFLQPEIGVILNITPSHSERYRDFEDYRKAKWGITTKMESQDLLLIPEGEAPVGSAPRCRVESVGKTDEALSFSGFTLPGQHHQANAAFCVKVLQEFARRHGKNEKALVAGMQETLDNFRGIPHRIEPVETGLRNVYIYNDSKSTNPQSTLAALEALADAPAPFFLILGGATRQKGVDIPATFWEAVAKRVDKVFFYGESGEEIYHQITSEIPSVSCNYIYSLEELCGEIHSKGNFRTLLFSPGFPSFDQFESYMARGDAFKAAFL